MRSQICIDASLVVALLIPERFSQAAFDLWQGWTLSDTQIVAPRLLTYDVTSAVYQKVTRGLIAPEDGLQVMKRFLALDIEMIDPPEISIDAIELAKQYKRPNPYDSHYLALALHLSCPFWTCDERLYNAVKDGINQIFYLGNYQMDQR